MDSKQLIAYDEWANRRIFTIISDLPEGKERVESFRLFNHILGAQKVWMGRINGTLEQMEIWPDLTLAEAKACLGKHPKKLKKLLSNEDEIITYKNSSRKEFTNTVGEIIQHLVIHGQHHRAQIAAFLRRAGVKPPATDFIFFLRILEN